MRGLAFLLLILAIAGTALGVVGIVYASIEDPVFFAPSFAILILPWIGWVLVRNRTTNDGKATFEAGLAKGFRADHQQWFKGSGLALDLAAGKLLVASRGSTAIHPVADLKAVLFVPESAGSVSAAGMSSTGLLGAILAIFAIGSATAGHLQSGLYLTLGEPARTIQLFGIGAKDAASWIERLQLAAPALVVKAAP